jgi:hypothetical protein
VAKEYRGDRRDAIVSGVSSGNDKRGDGERKKASRKGDVVVHAGAEVRGDGANEEQDKPDGGGNADEPNV